jgi:peptide chain release factor subunit 1
LLIFSEEHIVYTKEPTETPSQEGINSAEKLTVVDSMALTEWFTENYTRYGAQLEFVSDRSQEGSQFVKGFGGVGALLRFQLDVSTLDYEEEYRPSIV